MKKASRHQGIKASRGKKKAQMREGITTRRFAAGLDPAWTCAPGFATSQRRAVGFTLVELMIAVLVLVVVIVATSQIFGTVGKVTSLGQATADVLQEAAAIERQIRSDFERLAPNGVFAIRCRSIANDINFPGPLLNPALPAAATIRADQLLFFTNGVAGTQVFAGSSGASHKQQGTAARIYYGHAFQVPGADVLGAVSADAAVAFNNSDPLFPWSQDPAPPSLEMFNAVTGASLGDVDGTQPLASQWLLARQSVFLADDGGGTEVYLINTGGINSTSAIWDLAIRNSRLDIAASQLNDIRSDVVGDGTVPWIPDQRNVIGGDYLFYPRAERVAPSMDRIDHSLTANVLAGACSSFIVEWTYSNGVGEVRNDFGNVIWEGFQSSPEREQPWFGLDADLDGDGIPERGAHFYSDDTGQGAWWDGAETILPVDTMPNNLEQFFEIIPGQLKVYEAIFGYNRTTPLDPDTGQPWVPDSSPNAYTPWPSSIRITMFLHDPATKLEFGREIQFVINLPSRVE